MSARSSGRRSPPVQSYGSPSSARTSLRSGGCPLLKTRESLQEAKQQLEDLKKETLAMRAAEAQLKWGMKREEEKLRSGERQADAREVLTSRRVQRDEAARHLEAERRSRKEQENRDSRNFQEQKRMQKNQHKDNEERRRTQEYLENKEHSEWSVAMAKAAHAEHPKPIIEANLEKYQTMAAFRHEEHAQEKQEAIDARASEEHAELEHTMLLLQRERELAMGSLEHTRMNQQLDIPNGHHLAARPT
mmetsp:Transcript_8404/g.15766  ORF Transcript_8404/g.15766 Transcript_8404/m.15766 type:complete len:247 (-) Transcript_8404:103-843(-)